MVHHSECPVCSSTKVIPFIDCRDHFLSGETYQVLECTSCGLRFTQDYPEADAIGRYYESDDYISHSSSKSNLSDKIYQIVRAVMLRCKTRLIRKATGLQTGNLLDIGSGTGHFAAAMKKAGWQVWAVEINEKARAFSARELGVEAIPPGSTGKLPDSSFDCITLWHVLEHFHDPGGYMTEIARLLAPGGRCIIALPNCSSRDAVHYGSYWAAWDVPRHLWHFAPDSFSKFATLFGFNVLKRGILPLDVFYISFLSEKYKGSSFPLAAGVLRSIPWALKALFSKDKASSLIYTLAKIE